MERIRNLNKQLAGRPPKMTPDMKKEIERIQLQPKKIQVLEDQRRILEEFKVPSNIQGHHLSRFVLGKLYETRKSVAKFIDNDPDFNNYRPWKREKRDELRFETNLLLTKILKKYKFQINDTIEEFWRQVGVFETMGFGYGAIGTKIAVHCFLYGKSILSLGTKKHEIFAKRAFELKDFGCFGLTEVAHGSNAQGCITTATYDMKHDVFVVNTPHEKGAKFWIGNAAQTANMSICFANLIVDEVDYGVHLFLVPLRDENHHLMPGITVRDCGDKMSLDGIDNGMITYRNVRIPRDYLLDKITQVARDGTVTSKFPKKGKRFGVQLAALSDGRVKIGVVCLSQGLMACQIASRYSAVRRQFGAKKYDEQVLLNYPAVQRRLIPKYSSLLISYFAALEICDLWGRKSKDVFTPGNLEVKEMHALISIIKPLSSWLMMETTKECREICGGIGYSSYTRLPNLYLDNHVNVTWEGDNSVLLQQTARFLMKSFMRMTQGEPIPYPTLDFLSIADLSEETSKIQSKEDFKNLDLMEEAMIFLARKIIQDSGIQVQTNLMDYDAYDAWNKSLPFDLENASKIYGHLYIFRKAKENILSCPVEENRTFLKNNLLVYAIDILRRFSGYTLDYFSGEQVEMMEEVNLELFEVIKHNMVESFDYLLMTDTLTQSSIGAKDGNCYDRLVSDIFADRNNFGRPGYWKYLWEVRNGLDQIEEHLG